MLVMGLVTSVTGASRAAADDGDPALARTLIVIIPAKQGQTRATVALANPTGSDDLMSRCGHSPRNSARELFRQAFLIAARDEMGLSTRDEVLGDAAPPVPAEAARVELATVLAPDEGAAEPGGGAAAETRELTRRCSAWTWVQIRTGFGDLAKLCEVGGRSFTRAVSQGAQAAWARWQAEFASSRRRAAQGHGRDDFRTWDFWSRLRPFAMGTRRSGPTGNQQSGSGALVRGYSLLGVLTEHHWHPAHKVFKARGLLYAAAAGGPRPERRIWSLAPRVCRRTDRHAYERPG